MRQQTCTKTPKRLLNQPVGHYHYSTLLHESRICIKDPKKISISISHPSPFLWQSSGTEDERASADSHRRGGSLATQKQQQAWPWSRALVAWPKATHGTLAMHTREQPQDNGGAWTNRPATAALLAMARAEERHRSITGLARLRRGTVRQGARHDGPATRAHRGGAVHCGSWLGEGRRARTGHRGE